MASPLANSFECSFAGIPFLLDQAREVPRLSGLPIQESLYDRLDRLLPFDDLHDVYFSKESRGLTLGHLADDRDRWPEPGNFQLNRWYYPAGMANPSLFRGLATGEMAKAMLDGTAGGTASALFVMQAAPDGPEVSSLGYRLSTAMRLLPVRPLAEHGREFSGLYLVSLVDERYVLRNKPATNHAFGLWHELLDALAVALGITLTYSAIEPEYAVPDPDSQFWVNKAPASYLLDCAAANLGRTVVRKLDGTYALYTSEESAAVASANRKTVTARLAGGDLFASGSFRPLGDAARQKNPVVPETITVSFPKYVDGQDPVPHYYNPRRGTAWFEQSYGETHDVTVGLASGGPAASGLTGAGGYALHTTHKALFSGEGPARTGAPRNADDVNQLAAKVASDYWDSLALVAYDESYPGTLAWAPEGTHDLVWTYSARLKQASCRVTRSEWTAYPRYFQHGCSGVVPRQGGPLVAQVWRQSEADLPPGVPPASGVFMVNLATVKSPLRVERGVETLGGVNEAILAAGAAAGSVPGDPGTGGTANFLGTTFNYQGLNYQAAAGSTTYGATNFLNLNGFNQVNFYSSGLTSASLLSLAATTFNFYGNSFGGPSFNLYGGSTQNFLSGSLNFYGGASQLFVDAANGASLTVNHYPGDASASPGCFRFYSLYLHLGTVEVTAGQTLSSRQRLGTIGYFAPMAAHVHFQIGDSYTPQAISSGGHSTVGNSVDVDGWLRPLGNRAVGLAGPTLPSLTAAQVRWLKSRILPPVDTSAEAWCQIYGSAEHTGDAYYAQDVSTQPELTPGQDEGKAVYSADNSADLLTRVVSVQFYPGLGYGVVLQHDKVSDGCAASSLSVAETTADLPCTYGDLNLFTFESAVNFGNPAHQSASTLLLRPATFNVPTYFLNVVNLCSYWWWCGGDTFISTDGGVSLIEKAILKLRDGPGPTISTLRKITGLIDKQRAEIINTTGRTLTLENTIATTSGFTPGMSGYIALASGDYPIKTITGSNVTWPDGQTLSLWLDADAGYATIVGGTAALTGGSTGADEKVKATSGDTTAGYLSSKLTAGSNVTISVLNSGGNESLSIASTGGGGGSFAGARVYYSAGAPVISGSTWTALAFDSERYDTSGFHDNATNNTRLTAAETGYYHVGANVEWTGTTVQDYVAVRLRLGGTTTIAQVLSPTEKVVGAAISQNLGCDYSLSSGQYVEVEVYQNGTGVMGALSVNNTANYSPEFWIRFLGS